MNIIPLHKTDPEKVERVRKEMETLGSPTIRACWAEHLGAWVALEGCHRIAAAALTGTPVAIVAIEYGDELPEDLDWEFEGTVASVVDDAWERASLMVEVEEA